MPNKDRKNDRIPSYQRLQVIGFSAAHNQFQARPRHGADGREIREDENPYDGQETCDGGGDGGDGQADGEDVGHGGPDGEDLWLDGVVKKMAKSVQKQFPNAYNVKTTENELLSIELLPDGAWCVKRGNTWLLGGQYSLGEAPRHFQLLQESTD